MRTRSYAELALLGTIEERFDYLSIGADVGVPTFGFERYLNQRFYQSRQWRQVRQTVIARDLGCDLGVDGYDIHDQVYIHHMNPMTVEDIESGNPDILNPEYLISVTHRTHNAIHYGNRSQLPQPFVERHPGDTKLW
jgi:hypothetical protein